MAEHGGNLDEAAKAYGFAPHQMIDLSTGISPSAYEMALPPSSAYQALPLESSLSALYDAARSAYHMPQDAAICAGAGSQALLGALPYIIGAKMDKKNVIWCPEPTYNEHRYRWERAGFEVVGTPDCPSNAQVIILGQPNNPTGRIWSSDEIATYLEKMRERGGMVILDEAFVDAMPEQSSIPLTGDAPLLILRSVGKFYGLAGLRVGFAIGAKDVITQLADEIGPWPVSQPALLVATAALRDKEWQEAHRANLTHKSEKMALALAKEGFEVIAAMPLFVTITHPHMADFHHHLARHGYWSRIYRNDPTMMRLGLLPDGHDDARFEALLSGW